MKNFILLMRLTFILISIATLAQFGQQTTYGQSNPPANAQNAVSYNDRGIARQHMGDLDGAMADFNQAIRLNPKYSAAYDNRGDIKRRKGDLNGAMADSDEAIKLDPKSSGARDNPGSAKLMKAIQTGRLLTLIRRSSSILEMPSPITTGE
jgi:tetratricopeptide (TPR) repeat protein